MVATSFDLSQIRTDATAYSSSFRNLIGLGSSATLNAASANGVATLDGTGKLSAAQIPDISLISYLGSVASQAAMLALSGQQGDWCVRSDLSTTWVITGNDPTQLTSWTQLSYPAVPVQSVFGRTGAVVGVSTDYSAVGIDSTAIGAVTPSTGAFTTLSGTKATISTGTITASTPAVDISQTWNNAGVAFTAIKLNITDTASSADSLLFDFGTGGGTYTSQFKVLKNGQVLYRNGSRTAPAIGPSSNFGNPTGIYFDGLFSTYFTCNSGDAFRIHNLYTECYTDLGTKNLSLRTTGYVGWSATSNPHATNDVLLYRDAANILAQRNTTSAQTFRTYNTFTDASNYERGVLDWSTTSNVFRIGTEAAGTGTVRNIALVGGNVGIGTTSPTNPLDVYYQSNLVASFTGSVRSRMLMFGQASASAATMIFYDSPTTTNASYAGFGIDNTANAFGVSGVVLSTATNQSGGIPKKFTFGGYSPDAFQSALVLAPTVISGSTYTFNVGIANTSPAAKLDISDTTSAGSGSLAASTLNIASTWNTTGTPTLIKANVTDTASNAASLLMDLQVGGSSKAKINKSGDQYLANKLYVGPYVGYYTTVGIGEVQSQNFSVTGYYGEFYTKLGKGYTVFSNTSVVGWTSGDPNASSADLLLARDAANTLAQRNSTNAQTFNLYGTYTDASNYRRLAISSTTAGAFSIGVEGAGTGASGNTLTVAATGVSTAIPLSIAVDSVNIFTAIPTGSFSAASGQGAFRFIARSPHGQTIELDPRGTDGAGLISGVCRFISSTAFNFRDNFNTAWQTINCGTANVNGVCTLAPASLTGTSATSAIDISQTWNTTGTPTLIKANVTDTASNAASLLMDLQVGGSTKFKVDKSGNTSQSGNGFQNGSIYALGQNRGYSGGFIASSFLMSIFDEAAIDASNASSKIIATFAMSGGPGTLRFRSTGVLGWTGTVNTTDSMDTGLARDSAGVIAQRGSSQTYRLYGTYTDASNYRRLSISSTTAGAFTINAEGAGTGASGNTLTIGNDLIIPSLSRTNGFRIFDAPAGYHVFYDGQDYRGLTVSHTNYDPDTSAFISNSRNVNVVQGALAFGDGTYWVSDVVLKRTSANTISVLRGNFSTPGNFVSGTTSITPASLSGSSATSALDISQTWNTTGTPTLIKANVTDTASNANSFLFDLQVGGSSRFKVYKDGTIQNSNGSIALSTSISMNYVTGPEIRFGPATRMIWASTSATSGGNDLIFGRESANVFYQMNSTNAQTYRIYNTYTDASNYERGKLEWSSNVFRIGTEKAGTGSARALQFQTDGTTRLTISSDGSELVSTGLIYCVGLNAGAANVVNSGTSNYIGTIGSFFFKASSSGVVELCGASLTGSGFGRLQLGGTTSSFPAIKRNGTAINFRLADDSADAPITASQATLSATLDLTIRTVTYGATMAIDAALGNKIAITLGGNGTISNPTNAVDGRVLVFRLRQDGSGNRVPVWDTKYSFVGDLATVTLSTAANKIDRIAFEYDSTDDKWYCISFIKGS